MKSRRQTRRGGGCSGKVSIKNAMSRKNCMWERSTNGMAELSMPITQSKNNYYGGRRSRRYRRTIGGTASSSGSEAQSSSSGPFANGRSGPVCYNGRLPAWAADKW